MEAIGDATDSVNDEAGRMVTISVKLERVARRSLERSCSSD